MVYAKELAPNLFNTFEDWYRNYVNEMGKNPEQHETRQAVLYFLAHVMEE